MQKLSPRRLQKYSVTFIQTRTRRYTFSLSAYSAEDAETRAAHMIDASIARAVNTRGTFEDEEFDYEIEDVNEE